MEDSQVLSVDNETYCMLYLYSYTDLMVYGSNLVTSLVCVLTELELVVSVQLIIQ